MAASSHALDVAAYTLEAARLLTRMREHPKQAEPCPNKLCSAKPAPAALCLLVLGGLSEPELADLHVRLTSAIERVGGTACVDMYAAPQPRAVYTEYVYSIPTDQRRRAA